MRRIESDGEEQQEIDEALSRAATPTHMPKGWIQAVDRFSEQEQPTEEFDSLEVVSGLGEFGVTFGHLRLKDSLIPEKGWTIQDET